MLHGANIWCIATVDIIISIEVWKQKELPKIPFEIMKHKMLTISDTSLVDIAQGYLLMHIINSRCHDK